MIALPNRGGTVPCDNNAAVFWQSRMTSPGKVASFPAIINVSEFARKLACMGDGCGRTAPPALPSAEVAESSSDVSLGHAIKFILTRLWI